MKLKVILLSIFALLIAQTTFAQTKAKAKSTANKTEQVAQHRVVYDVVSADSAQQGKIMKHLEKMLNHWPDAQLEMVVHGKGLDMLVKGKATAAEQLKVLQDKGVKFVACENAMRAHNVQKEQLLPGVLTVPMGVVEIIEKQEEGYSYIKL
ncbi:intracellular sulfur oxidation DsrE/DsrF family protein [Pontibacter aydingkolensis]|uniref:DsrE family protein n=1 Tax=Pontibacter aydingkolensis TaxID=1911536 RepID=A0ABS7CVW0_9BACT|nr:DsrE family protein [Pontibacter aydingkolensis]MBW7468003.1 DsrE family protein [Pontibacter aydingkolensis]